MRGQKSPMSNIEAINAHSIFLIVNTINDLSRTLNTLLSEKSTFLRGFESAGLQSHIIWLSLSRCCVRKCFDKWHQSTVIWHVHFSFFRETHISVRMGLVHFIYTCIGLLFSSYYILYSFI